MSAFGRLIMSDNYRTTVGKVQLVSLTDGHFEPVPTDVFQDSDIETWQSEYSALMIDKDHTQFRFGSVAIYSASKIVVVDTGAGPNGCLIDDMGAKGVEREDVDFVLITHLHADHTGWPLLEGEPTFPNARYLVPKDDYAYWTQPNVISNAPNIANDVVPLKSLGVIDLIEPKHIITSELTTVHTPGHTPGHTSLAISSNGESGFVLGDVAHSPAQAHYTDWNPNFDVDQELSRETRNQVLDELEEQGILVQAGHFPEPGFGHFSRENNRRYWQGV